jgi:hypothetical protein
MAYTRDTLYNPNMVSELPTDFQGSFKAATNRKGGDFG